MSTHSGFSKFPFNLAHVLICAELVASAVISIPQQSTVTGEQGNFSVLPKTFTSLPQIWVAVGIVDCGAPLEVDLCVIQGTSYSYTTVPTSTKTDLFTQLWDPVRMTNVDSTYTGYETFKTTSSASYMFGVRASKMNPYTPTIIRSQFTPNTTRQGSTATVMRRNKRAIWMEQTPTPTPTNFIGRISSPSTDPLALTATMRNPFAANGAKVFGRSYDFDRCKAQPPNHDFVSNSLNEVCHYVANIQGWFVSLAPLSAAYMPSWTDYLTSIVFTLLPLLQIFFAIRFGGGHDKEKTNGLTCGNIITAGARLLTIIRTLLAIIRIFQHRQSLETLPFISPLLWVDWIAVAGASYEMTRKRGIAVTITTIAVCVFIMCLWLTIGYDFLGYGVRQYHILQLPEQCENLGISWQTDPRRRHFVRLHTVIFLFAICGCVIALKEWLHTSEEKWSEGARHKAMVASIGIMALIPTAFAALIVGVINRTDYLILGQRHCYASFVSSRFGYFMIDYIDWSARAAAWLGVHV